MESAESATAAWRALLAREGGRPSDVARLSGPRLFGLDNRIVQRLVQALPHAPRCARFGAWLGTRPEAEPLVGCSLLTICPFRQLATPFSATLHLRCCEVGTSQDVQETGAIGTS